MTIRYQRKETETEARTVAEFLQPQGVDVGKVIVEYNGEIYAPGADLAALALNEGATLEVFRIMAGG